MMDQFIVTEKCSMLRMLGREALRGRWMLAFAAVILYTLATYVPSFALEQIFSNAPMVSAIYQIIVAGPLTLGYSIFLLSLFRNDWPTVGQVFYGFERFGKSLGAMLLIVLFVTLWSLLIVPGVLLASNVPFFTPFALLLAIPAIIASIRYSQAFFILADHPETGARECVAKSKWMMQGNKLKYFFLVMSFIGWALLASIPAFALGFATAMRVVDSMDLSVMEGFGQYYGEFMLAYSTYYSPIGQLGYSIATSVAYVPFMVYMMASLTAFYEMAAGNLRPGYIMSTAEVIDTAGAAGGNGKPEKPDGWPR